MIYDLFVDFTTQTDTQRYALCPFHSEKTPSFTVNTQTEDWYCHGCNEGGGPREFLMRIYDIEHSIAEYAVHTWDTKRTLPFPTEEYVQTLHSKLMDRPSELAALAAFGITKEAIVAHQIGWEDLRYTFPIKSRTGYYINVRKYLPPHRRVEGTNNAKLLSMKGLGKGAPRFYPYEAFESDNPLVIVEGEKDCIAARAQGLNAITGTGGSTLPLKELGMFAGRDVYIMTDTDAVGNKLAREYSNHLLDVALRIHRITLPQKDFVEYLQAGGVVGEIWKYSTTIAIPEELGSSEDLNVQDLTLTASEHVFHLDTWTQLKNITVLGADPQVYVIPNKLECLCTNPRCKFLCPLAPSISTGKGKIIEVPSRELLAFLGNADTAQHRCAQSRFKCKHVMTRPASVVNAQKLIFQESASFIDGLEESSFEHRYGVYLFTDNRLSATKKYDFLASRATDSRTQSAYYLIKEATTALGQAANLTFEHVYYFQDVAKTCETAEELIAKHYDDWLPTLGIEGRPDLFGAALLTYCSVTEIPWQNGNIKGWLDTMVIGDTRTGKSQMAQRFVKTLQLGGYINGENARRTGVIGGVQQFGGSWVITWGAIPLNDRGLLIIDEASGLDVEDVKDLSSTRSSGAVTINKVVKGEARARTRLLWLSNPRSGTNLQDFYWRGYGAFQEFIPVAEDQARYDLVLSAAQEDVTSLQGIPKRFNKPHIRELRALIKWAWQLKEAQVEVLERAEAQVKDAVADIAENYAGGPLIVPVALHEKILRLACAFAVLAGSIDLKADKLVVDAMHVNWAQDFLESVLSKPSLAYKEYIAESKRARQQAADNTQYVIGLIIAHPALKAVLSARTFRGSQFQEVLGIERSDAAKMLSALITRGLVQVQSHAVYKTTGILIDIARSIK